jgi:3-deoxy-manno-octulosonate cytidylyltransferase (CMP-KDO synthetase)
MVTIIIPARMGSSRFPGKPLAMINGKEMLLRVFEQCKKTGYRVGVATDDIRIVIFCIDHKISAYMTSPDCLTGADRVAEAIKQFRHPGNVVVSVQGDEPLIDPSHIQRAVSEWVPGTVVNCMANTGDQDNYNTIKMVVGKDNRLIYASRAAVPGKKNIGGDFVYKKQVCVSVYSPEMLCRFFGIGRSKSLIEIQEDIDILRFVENDIPVHVVDLHTVNTQSVDVPEDIEKVERILNDQSIQN